MKMRRKIKFLLFFILSALKVFSQSPVKQWDYRFGGSEKDLLTALEQTSDSGYILGGFSSSNISGDKTQDVQGGSDYWIVKTDADGIKQWDAAFGGNKNDELY